MSLLMDALKVQQQQDVMPAAPVPAAETSASQQGWKMLALLLLMLVGILLGFLLADWWQQRQQPVAIPVVPATPAQIVGEILAVKAAPAPEVPPLEEPQLLVSALPGAGKQLKTRQQAVADSEALTGQDDFVAEAEMAMADPDEEVLELPGPIAGADCRRSPGRS